MLRRNLKPLRIETAVTTQEPKQFNYISSPNLSSSSNDEEVETKVKSPKYYHHIHSEPSISDKPHTSILIKPTLIEFKIS
jgi:hypothetical protein